jgi:putative endonuclease
MAYVYILYSPSLDKFYVGFTTETPELRLERHNSDYYENKFTANGKPWILFLAIECSDAEQARKIEAHIKSMKSQKYIRNLAVYPEIIEKLKLKFHDC